MSDNDILSSMGIAFKPQPCGRCWTRRRLFICSFLSCGAFLSFVLVSFLIVWYKILDSNDVDYDLTQVAQTEREVFISAERAAELINSETGATVLDARSRYHPVVERTKPGYGESIDGARRCEWTEFTLNGDRDYLKPVEEIERIFRDKGVSNDVPVVVFGSWKEEWGEEGRIFWQLDWLNHTQAYILYGGIFGWTEGGYQGRGRDGEGDFVARPVTRRHATEETITRLISSDDDVVIIDARTEGEYNGETPYGSARGGHIPTSVNYDWDRVFNPDGSGNLRPVRNLTKEFRQLGLTNKDQRVIVYCTSGIRAGFLYSVLSWIGHDVANYAGSWFMWSQDNSLPAEV